MNDLIDDPIDPEKQKAEDLRAQLEADALRIVLQSRHGRRFIWALLGKCGFTRNAYTGENNATNFNCGRQSVATDLLVEIDSINPDAFHLMSKEAKEDKAYDNRNPDRQQHDSIAAFNTSNPGS